MKTISIVMFISRYPVEDVLADSLAKPGKNITGNAGYAGTEIWSKLLRLLREVKPEAQRVGVLWSYGPPVIPKDENEPAYRELRSAEQSLGLKIDIFKPTNTAEMSLKFSLMQHCRQLLRESRSTQPREGCSRPLC
jgi:ABC-type uncharacterized transport system substrate-binding protein